MKTIKFSVGDTVGFAKWWAIGQGIWPYVKNNKEYRGKVVETHSRNLITVEWKTGEIHHQITGNNLKVVK